MKTITSKVIKALNLTKTEDNTFIYKDTISFYRIKDENKNFSFIFGVMNLKSDYAFNDISIKYINKYHNISECITADFIKDVKEFYNEVIKLNESLVLTDEMIKEKNELVKTNVELLNSIINNFDYKTTFLNVNMNTSSYHLTCIVNALQDLQSMVNKLNKLLEDNSYDSLINVKDNVKYVDFYIKKFNEENSYLEFKNK